MRSRTVVAIANADEREQIYRIRHDVYAAELGQHARNHTGRLTDDLDAVNTYLVARRDGDVLGFVAITTPTPVGYSIDKYFPRANVPVSFDDGLFEIRLLTVVAQARRGLLAVALMERALRWCEARGAHTVVAIGRLELIDVYRRVGMRPLGQRATSGAVAYELMAATVRDLRDHTEVQRTLRRRVERETLWLDDSVDTPTDDGCYHGGAFFEAIGDEFDDLGRARDVINADVLDAWFPPAPAVLQAVSEHLSFALRTSPPTGADGLRRVIARERGVAVESILPGAGSSDLIFAAFRAWLTSASRVLILDPMYGEYAHVLEKVVGAQVDRLTLSRASDFDVSEVELSRALSLGYDWAILVNPNSPTGRYLPGPSLKRILSAAPPSTKVWVDETYLEYVGGTSLETLAASSTNIVVCKSMSKAYALSGVRAGYLCGPGSMIRALQTACPPWAVSLPAQIAACAALRATDYYRARWHDTNTLRASLAAGLTRLGLHVVPGCANFVLCRLPENGPTAADVVRAARLRGLFLREVENMGRCLDGYDIRIAVKDDATNQRILDILGLVLKEQSPPDHVRAVGRV